MGPPSYMQSVVDRNTVTRCMTLCGAANMTWRWIPIMQGERNEEAWRETLHLWRVGTCRKLRTWRFPDSDLVSFWL